MKDEALMEKLAGEAILKMEQFKPQELSNIYGSKAAYVASSSSASRRRTTSTASGQEPPRSSRLSIASRHSIGTKGAQDRRSASALRSLRSR